MRTLIIRMMGLGDVASILVPAVRHVKHGAASGCVDVLTFGAGVELMELVPEIDDILAVTTEQWPDDLVPATNSFLSIAEMILARGYARVINLDTWFMPCFLARALKDLGVRVEGNVMNRSVVDLLRAVMDGSLTQDYFSLSANYMTSSFPAIADWQRPWWNDGSNHLAYPDYYLNHCVGWKGTMDRSITVEADVEMKRQSAGRKIVALSTAGRKINYPARDELMRQLETAGFYVWGQFDGSVPMRTTLGRLKVSDLLISLPTATQWLAHAVGCPTLLIPGPQPPQHLRPEAEIERTESCQYCAKMSCPLGLNFPCLDIPPERIVKKTEDFFARRT